MADNDQRAKQIDDVLAVTYAREPVILETQGIEQLLALLDGLDDAVRTAVLGPDDLVPVDRLPEVVQGGRTACGGCSVDREIVLGTSLQSTGRRGRRASGS